MCLYVSQNDTGLDREGKPTARERPDRLELSAVVVFTPPLWLMPEILGQTFSFPVHCKKNGADKVGEHSPGPTLTPKQYAPYRLNHGM